MQAMSKNRNTLKVVSLSILILALAACGGSGKQVVTEDNSADYKSSTSLPPLKKPSKASPPTVASEVEPTLDNTVVTSEAGVVSAPIEDSTLASNSPLPDVADAQTEPSDRAVVTRSISSRVIPGGSDSARLQIDANFDSAWAYMTENLKNSDVTVFSRNKEAGRFSIGCGSMDSVKPVKKGGWSIFNKGKQKLSEYCALSVVERRGKSLVFVLNRDNTEVADQYSNPLFARILNN